MSNELDYLNDCSYRKGMKAVSIEVTESLRLEKTSKITKSNHQTIITIPTKPCPEVPHLHIF